MPDRAPPAMRTRDRIGAAIDAAVARRDAQGRILPEAQSEVARLKAQALGKRIAGTVREWRVGNLTAVVRPTGKPRGCGGDPLCFRLTVATAKGRVVHEDDHVVFNPPVMARVGEDADGSPIFEEDHDAALQQMVAALVRRAVGL